MTPSIEVFQDEPIFESSLKSDSTIESVRKLSVSVNKAAVLRASVVAEISSSSSSSKDQLARELINRALVNHISGIDHEECEAGDEDSFFVCDLGEVYRSFGVWQQKLPQVQPHYAVKCNTNLEVIKLLASLGVNFDCASKNEIDTILNLGISPDRIVYANPCKTNSFIRHASKANVNLTTVDNAQELHKLKKFHPDCGILIRLATDDETAQCRLSTKFGCTLSAAINELLPLAKELGLNVRGVAFHVGSGAKDFDSIYKAIRDSRDVFNRAITEYGFEMSILDIGGGFELETFDESSSMVCSSLNKFFPADFVSQNGIKFIAEPGRFMVSNAFTLAAHIIARRDLDLKATFVSEEDKQVSAMVYINDGVYGNMNCILFDHQNPQAHVLQHKNKFFYHQDEESDDQKLIDDDAKGEHHFSIWGPTCDGLDCVASKCTLSHDVEVGDWLYFPNLGAYTLSLIHI